MATYIYFKNGETLTWNIHLEPNIDAIRIQWKKTLDTNFSTVFEGSPMVNSQQIELPGDNMIARCSTRTGGSGGGWSPYSVSESVMMQ